ncbi:MAG: UDP-4-amino-4,6-dideoxy-N-acetyl-beta-L-altrosamine transaminase [Candidatus Riflebacteria bacterium]|nr:UDP-4-amino-4,6-dideoxy-N-acetyl-beta-L-altrosamine transaminase [Candidatus Riflebacteria bacterium]
MKFIPYAHQSISDEDIAAVVRTLKSDFLSQGPEIGRFEKEFATFVNAPFAVACASGTAALHLGCLAAGIGAGDRVLTTPITFVASANCARYVGASVEFADINPETCLLDPGECEKMLDAAQRAGKPFKAVITVDLAGYPCDMQAFSRLKEKFGFIWIEDACHALGATWTNNHGEKLQIGACKTVDLTIYSFHPVKHITTGEGGMITAHDSALDARLRLFRSHGINRASSAMKIRSEAFDETGAPNPWYYEMQELGFNYRLSDIQAALGTSQLARLPIFLTRRHEVAARYRSAFTEWPYIIFPKISEGLCHAYHLVIVLIDFKALGKSRVQVMNELRAKGIGTQVHYLPVPMMPAYGAGAENPEGAMKHLPAALAYYRHTLSIPCFSDISDDEVERVVSALKEAVK